MCVCSSQAESRLPTALLLLLVILQAAKGLICPVGPHDWGAQCVTLTAYSTGQMSPLAAIILVEDEAGDEGARAGTGCDSGFRGHGGHLGCMTDPKLLDQKPRGLA